MKKEYMEPIAELEFFNITSPVTTSRLGWEEEDGAPWSLRDSKEVAWG